MKYLFKLAKLAEAYDRRGQRAVADFLDSALVQLAAEEEKDTYAGGFREGLMSAVKILDISSDIPTIKRYLLQVADTLEVGPHAGVPEEELPEEQPLEVGESAAEDGRTGGPKRLERLLNFDL